MALNLFDDRESNLAAPAPVVVPPEAATDSPHASSQATESLASLLALLALIALGADLVRRLIHRARRSDA
jgi:flagellar biogenesis protein FliO